MNVYINFRGTRHPHVLLAQGKAEQKKKMTTMP